ncbi:MAG: hypothetical protein IT222_01360 [Crocinitomix sp.]|nr:hypothetical protein [Crocinitomix sp.]
MCVDDSFKWSDISQTLIAIASLVISLMAYLLAKKISFKKSVKDRQFEVVSQFMKAFSSSIITVSWQAYGGGGGSALLYLTQLRSEKLMQEHSFIGHSIFTMDTKLIIQEDAFNHFIFMSLIGDPFLPEEIYVELKKLWFRSTEKIETPQVADTYLIICNNKDYLNPNYYVPQGDEFKDFKSFHKFINKIMDITNDWLDKHEASELKFRD